MKPTIATPLYVIENPDSPSAQVFQRFLTEYTEAADRHHSSAPRNQPHRYITLAEIADRIGVQRRTMWTNAFRPGRKEYLPFDPVITAGGGVTGKPTHYYDRTSVERWIGKYNRKKGQHATRARGRDAGRGNPAQPEHLP